MITFAIGFPFKTTSAYMIRDALSVIAGYAIFVITSLALFTVSGQNAHAEASVIFIAVTAIYGAFFSFLSGMAVQQIAYRKKILLNYILAAIMAGFAAFSMLRSAGSHWTQYLAIVVFAPVSILGGLFYRLRFKH